MKFALRRLSSFRIPTWVGLGIGLMAVAVQSDPPYEVLLERYGQEIQAHPQDYSQRSERTALILEHGDWGDTTADDIDTLLSHPAWHTEGECLEAIRLDLQGHLEQAKILIRENIHAHAHVQEQSRIMASIELSERDTGAAIAAYRMAWDQDHDETDYMNLLGQYRGRGRPPEDLLQQGLRIYPLSPGPIQTIFEVYFAAGDTVSLRNAVAIADNSEKMVWPQSVDWKIRHAQALISLGRDPEAETVLLAALDLLDGNPHLQDDAGQPLRQQIFTLLKVARK